MSRDGTGAPRTPRSAAAASPSPVLAFAARSRRILPNPFADPIVFNELALPRFDASWRRMKSTKTDEQASVVIRRMGPGELGEVTDAWYRSLIGSVVYLRPEQLRSEEAYKGFFREVVVTTRDLWVAELGGRVAGVLALKGDEIDRLYVAPEAQRRTVGTALLEHAKALHPKGLTLVTHQRNTGARRFYEGHGFVACEFGMSPPPENEPDVTYAWSGSSR